MPTDAIEPAPPLTLETAARLARDRWGVHGRAAALPSYIDANVHITPEHGDHPGFVLKVANAYEPRAELDLQNAAMRWIHARLPGACPLPQETSDGRDIIEVELAGRVHLARLISFLPGQLYSSARPHDDALLTSLGRFMGKLDRALAGFEHPAADRALRWDLAQAGWIEEHLDVIEDPQRHALVEGWLVRFHERILPGLRALPQSVVHNDANDNNLIVAGREVVGIIDFGDIVRTARICELAITVAYALLDQHDPLAAASTVIAAYHRERALSPEEQALLMPLVGLRYATSVVSSARGAALDPDNEYIRISERPVWRALEQLAAIPAESGLLLETVRDACGPSPDPARPRASLRAARRALQAERRERLGPNLSLSYREPLDIVRGRGAALIDREGRAFLDCVNNVCHVGHAHPRVVAALTDQAARLNTNTRYLHDNLIAYARRLTATLPEPLRVCFFVNSGSEANDLALRLARAHTGGEGVVVIDGGYHGNLGGLVALSPYKCEGPGGAGLAGHARKIPLPDGFRGRYRVGAGDRPGPRYAEHVSEAFAALQGAGHEPAAFLSEAILSCGGQLVPPDGFHERAYERARAAGAVCIADEVQTGFGRVGLEFWAFAAFDVVPDIVTMGKPIGNGHPMGAVVTTPAIAASFANGMEYFNTFGGNPVSCAVGLAVLDVIEDEGLQDNALAVGDFLQAELAELMDRHARVGEVRGLGLFLGVELVDDRVSRRPDAALASAVVERLRARGILLSADGPDHNVLKIKPPLVFSNDDARRLVSALDDALGVAE